MNTRKSRWLWIALFVWVALLLGTLATGWNVLIVRDYRRMVELARSVSIPGEMHAPWTTVILGTLGFAAALVTLILFFVRLLSEMKLNQLQSEFLATVSHELKTPIAAIDLASSLIRTGGLTADDEKKLWISHQTELARLRTDVETLLEAARWQTRPEKVKPGPVDLERWLGESLPRWKKILGPAGEVLREGEPLPRDARLDLRAMDLITDNLLDNARKYSKGDPVVRIRTRRIAREGWWKPALWQIQIEDRGWGFAPADSKRIFTRFIRGRTEAPHAIPGTGLGLYLARSASRSLKVSLRGESPGVGQGAVFTLEGVDSKRAPVNHV